MGIICPACAKSHKCGLRTLIKRERDRERKQSERNIGLMFMTFNVAVHKLLHAERLDITQDEKNEMKMMVE